ncbi:MAG: hypothetical protein AB1765_03440 [Candidatus Hydrogenedentota bacterium]
MRKMRNTSFVLFTSYFLFLIFITALHSGEPSFSNIPLDEYIELIEKIEDSKKPVIKPIVSPITTVLVSGNYTLIPENEQLSVDGQIEIHQFVDTFSIIPLFKQNFRFKNALLNNKSAPLLVTENNEQAILLRTCGKYRLSFSGSAPLTQKNQTLCKSQIILPRSGVSQIFFNKQFSKEATYQRSVDYEGKEIIEVTWIPLSKVISADIKIKTIIKEEKLSALLNQSVVISENFISGTINTVLNTFNLKDKPIFVSYPDWIQILNVSCDRSDITVSFEPVSDTLTLIRPSSFWQESVNLFLYYTQKSPVFSENVNIPQITIVDAKPEVIKIGISSDNVRLSPVKIEKAGLLDPSELSFPSLFAYKSIHKDFYIEFKREPINPLNVITGYCKNSSFRVIRTNDGDGVIQSIFKIKSTNLPFFTLKIPEGSTVLSIFSDGQPVKAGSVDKQTVKIPLPVNIQEKETSLEVWLNIPKKKFYLFNFIKQELPYIELIQENVKLNMLYPEEVYPVYFSGSWDQLPLPRETGGIYRMIFLVIKKILRFIFILIIFLLVVFIILLFIAGLWFIVYKIIKLILPYPKLLTMLTKIFSIFIIFIICVVIFIFLIIVFLSMKHQLSTEYRPVVNEKVVGEGQASLSAEIYGPGTEQEEMADEKRLKKAKIIDKIREEKKPQKTRTEEFFKQEIKQTLYLTEGVLPVRFQFPEEGIAYTGQNFFPEARLQTINIVLVSKNGISFIYLIFFCIGFYIGYKSYKKWYKSQLEFFKVSVLFIIISIAVSYVFYGIIFNLIIGFIMGRYSPVLMNYMGGKFLKTGGI